MAVGFYERLGVDKDADPGLILDAYLGHLREVQPGVSIRRDHHQVKNLYVAYLVLSDPEQRARYDEAVSTLECPWCGQPLAADDVEHHVSNHVAENARNGCIVCGRVPVRRFTFRSVDGLIVWHRKHLVEGNLCLTCTTGEFRSMQARNVARGPWGLFSIFMTPFYLLQNWAAHRKSASMQKPDPEDPTYDEVGKGRPTLRRPSVWASLFVLATALILVAQLATSSAEEPTARSQTEVTTTLSTVEDTEGWSVGVCARIDMAGRPSAAPCDGDHYAAVIAMVESAGDCPAGSDWTLPAGESVACFQNA